MALINCTECGKQVSDTAEKCPQCGCPIRETVDDGQVSNTTTQIEYEYYYRAPLGRRLVASILDGLIAVALFIPAILWSSYEINYFTTHLAHLFESGEIFFFVILCLLPFGYILIKDGLGKGQSWGKKAVGLMVVYLPDNTPCSKWRSCLRCLIGSLLGGLIGWLCGGIPIVGFVGQMIDPILVLVTTDGRRLADFAAGTQVIEKIDY